MKNDDRVIPLKPKEIAHRHSAWSEEEWPCVTRLADYNVKGTGNGN